MESDAKQKVSLMDNIVQHGEAAYNPDVRAQDRNGSQTTLYQFGSSTESASLGLRGHGMNTSLKAVPASVAAISVNEFYGVFWKLLHLPRSDHGCRFTRNIGLAISGGVDSMALASLCAQLAMNKPRLDDPVKQQINFNFRAFIVDHGVRTGSAEEAEAVKNVLHSRNIPANILKIRWPKDIEPGKASNFESLARTYRFQALGKACRGFDTQGLLLAHHEDDQVETVLMRMLRGHRGTELGGITDRTVIPECFGMYGINESGQMDMVYHSKSPRYPEPSIPPDNDHVRKLPEAHLGRIKQEVDVEPHQHDVVIPIGTTLKAPTTETLGPLPCEEGGVQVLRPLLSFSKERLQATCLADGMPWFEDLTNIDPTITQRNAIRHIYANYSLPVALQKPAILSLSQAWTLRGASYEAAATNHLASETQITSFDPRCGSITLRFAFLPDTRVTAESPVRWPFKQQQIAIRLLRTTIEAVSPEPHIKLDRLRRVQRTVFPHLFEPDPFSSERSLSFTVAGVRIERSDWIKKKSKSISCEDADDIHRDHHFNHEWRITREPHRGSVNRVQLTIPAGTLPQWNLYDGRYWIRLCNRTSTSTLRVRPFCTGDSGSFRRKFSSKEQIRLGLLLKTLVPGDLRWTLPAIVMSDDHGIDQVLSLPTLGFDAPGMETFLSYEIRYKKVHPKICVHAAENLCSTCV